MVFRVFIGNFQQMRLKLLRLAIFWIFSEMSMIPASRISFLGEYEKDREISNPERLSVILDNSLRDSMHVMMVLVPLDLILLLLG